MGYNDMLYQPMVVEEQQAYQDPYLEQRLRGGASPYAYAPGARLGMSELKSAHGGSAGEGAGRYAPMTTQQWGMQQAFPTSGPMAPTDAYSDVTGLPTTREGTERPTDLDAYRRMRAAEQANMQQQAMNAKPMLGLDDDIPRTR